MDRLSSRDRATEKRALESLNDPLDAANGAAADSCRGDVARPNACEAPLRGDDAQLGAARGRAPAYLSQLDVDG